MPPRTGAPGLPAPETGWPSPLAPARRTATSSPTRTARAPSGREAPLRRRRAARSAGTGSPGCSTGGWAAWRQAAPPGRSPAADPSLSVEDRDQTFSGALVRRVAMTYHEQGHPRTSARGGTMLDAPQQVSARLAHAEADHDGLGTTWHHRSRHAPPVRLRAVGKLDRWYHHVPIQRDRATRLVNVRDRLVRAPRAARHRQADPRTLAPGSETGVMHPKDRRVAEELKRRLLEAGVPLLETRVFGSRARGLSRSSSSHSSTTRYVRNCGTVAAIVHPPPV